MSSMQPDVADRLAEGGRALDAGAWEEARDAFEPLVAGEKLPESLLPKLTRILHPYKSGVR